MTRSLLLILTLLLLPLLPARAQEQQDTAFQQLRERYLQLYNIPDKEAEFKEASELMKAYYQEKGNLDSYYKVRINEALYDSERGHSYSAIKKANNTLEDMKRDGIKQYQVVYTVLGSIFDSRGNYRMAKKYYLEALKNAVPTDTGSVISIYSRLADLTSTREPQEAWKWNEQFGSMVRNNPNFYKVYLILKGQISFFLQDKRKFASAYQEVVALRQQHPEINDYGLTSMKLMHEVFQGNYDKVLKTIQHDTLHRKDLNQLDIRIKAYQIMKMDNRAMDEVEKRRDLRDSLNSDMLFNNINEINAELGIAKLNEEAAREREIWLAAVIVLLLTGLGLTVSRYMTRRRYQKELLKQNKELEIALSRAEESDRMKSLFIEHVSHEIRTPLNIITGYAQIITNPSYDLEEKDRDNMLNAIKVNTMEITDIVNELLDVANDESKEYLTKDDNIAVNAFCRELLDKTETKNNGRLEIKFKTDLSDGYTFKCNKVALEKTIMQLMGNALKFTEQGFVELYVHDSPDHGVIRFIISDTGIGISEQYKDKVFDRFFKADTFKQGFGLGLTISRKAANLLGGSLHYDSTYTKGARFILTLPAA